MVALRGHENETRVGKHAFRRDEVSNLTQKCVGNGDEKQIADAPGNNELFLEYFSQNTGILVYYVRRIELSHEMH